MPHIVSSDLLQSAVRIHVVGCGGTGSAVVPGLAKIHRSMIALGHPAGLDITIWDEDTVALHNTIRQNFFEADVGHMKAEIMANRMRIAHAPAGLSITARNDRFPGNKYYSGPMPHFIVGCVDSKASRRSIRDALGHMRACVYWIDCGNESASGQVIVGQGGERSDGLENRLPLVSELFPEIINGEDDNTPSCSARESISRQGVMTNTIAATWALAWIDAAMRTGEVAWSGVFFNTALGRVTSIPAEPEAWKKLGFKVKRKRKTKSDGRQNVP